MDESKKDMFHKGILHRPITNKVARLVIILCIIFVTLSVGVSLGAHLRSGGFERGEGNYYHSYRGMEGRQFRGGDFEGGCGQRMQGGDFERGCGQQGNAVDGRQFNTASCPMNNSLQGSVVPVAPVETSTTITATSTIQ